MMARSQARSLSRSMVRRAIGFNIASTNPSAIYDRTALATLFQDSAGTTPVTAGSQPIGLGLDQSQGLALGPELVTNGDFSDGDTNWNLQDGWSVSGGKAVASGSGGTLIYQVGVPLTAGRYYQITMTISDYVSGRVVVGLSYYDGARLQSNGTHTQIVKCIGTAYFSIGGELSFFGSVSGISVKLLAGNHQSQANAGKLPITDGTPIYANFDAVDDDLVATFPASLGSGCTVCRSLPATGASITTGVTLTATYTDNVDAHALLIYTAAQWAALDAGQIAKITAWLNAKAGL